MTIDELIIQLETLPPAFENDPFTALKTPLFDPASNDDLLLIAECIPPSKYDLDRILPLSLHACRLLIMRKEMNLTYYTTLWDENIGPDYEDELLTDMTWCIIQLGEKGIKEALSIISDQDMDLELRLGLVDSLEDAVKELKSSVDIFEHFASQLREMRPEREVNAMLVASIITNCPDRFHQEILAIYDANIIDVSMNGDREDVEVSLGLRTDRSTEPVNPYDLEATLHRKALLKELGPYDPKAPLCARVDYFLTLYRTPLGAQSPEMLEAVYAVIIGAPEMIRPAFIATLPWNLHSTEPILSIEFTSPKDTERCTSALMEFYNSINTSVLENQYFPSLPLYPDDDRNHTLVTIDDWLLGIEKAALLLKEIQGSNDYSEALIEAHFEVLKNTPIDPLLSLDEAEVILQPIISVICARSASMTGGPFSSHSPPFTANRVRPAQAAPKIGRNDPCPCGSGKKFKRCCAN